MPKIGSKHGPSHENDGNDEINISGLTGAVEIEDTPVNGHTTQGISSNWAYDHATNKDAHHAVFVDRGDPADDDFDQTDLPIVGSYADLDVSSIVPAGAIAILYRLVYMHPASGMQLTFQKKGNSNDINKSQVFTQVANIYAAQDCIVALDASRVFQYFQSTSFSYIRIAIRGWWI